MAQRYCKAADQLRSDKKNSNPLISIQHCLRNAANKCLQKDTADGEADLKHGGDDAEWVEDPLISGQNTPPGQLSEHDGVKADACEAESSSQEVEECHVMRLRSAIHAYMRVRGTRDCRNQDIEMK